MDRLLKRVKNIIIKNILKMNGKKDMGVCVHKYILF